jgi:tRNA-dihydrouridine synthase A
LSLVKVAKTCALRVQRAVVLPRKASHHGVEKSAHDPTQQAETTEKMLPNQEFKFSVAPMMDWTDRRCRAFHRVLTHRARLYTEMVTADAVVFGPRERLIGFERDEHPVALQLGGADPSRLAEAARIAASFGYDEINLNCGCPSDRVQRQRSDIHARRCCGHRARQGEALHCRLR